MAKRKAAKASRTRTAIARRRKTSKPKKVATRKRAATGAKGGTSTRARTVSKRRTTATKAAKSAKRATPPKGRSPAAAAKPRTGATARKPTTIRASGPKRRAAARPATRPNPPAATPPKAAAPRKAQRRPAGRRPPGLDRQRRVVFDDDQLSPPSELDFKRDASAARSGGWELRHRYDLHTETGPTLTGGDVDADWESAYSVGDEAPGGDNPTPDQDIVDDIGRAIGVQYDDNEELKGEDKIVERDRHRWELDPASSDDYGDRED